MFTVWLPDECRLSEEDFTLPDVLTRPYPRTTSVPPETETVLSASMAAAISLLGPLVMTMPPVCV